MAGKLAKEIHKAKPFDSLQQEVFLNVIRTADHFMRAFEDLLKPFNLSATQYNVLRILRGHQAAATSKPAKAPPGIPCKVIGEEMITRDPDITRLLDRLEVRGLIARQRDTEDRRVVCTKITPEGLKLLKQLDQPVADFHRARLTAFPDAKLQQFNDLLEEARE